MFIVDCAIVGKKNPQNKQAKWAVQLLEGKKKQTNRQNRVCSLRAVQLLQKTNKQAKQTVFVEGCATVGKKTPKQNKQAK